MTNRPKFWRTRGLRGSFLFPTGLVPAASYQPNFHQRQPRTTSRSCGLRHDDTSKGPAERRPRPSTRAFIHQTPAYVFCLRQNLSLVSPPPSMSQSGISDKRTRGLGFRLKNDPHPVVQPFWISQHDRPLVISQRDSIPGLSACHLLSLERFVSQISKHFSSVFFFSASSMLQSRR